ncbi:MAG TPA: anti-sigma factor, partial [Thermomicrobiales bacterium]|nr:anti-sigma factor [Thermomicrobiales bacterium]
STDADVPSEIVERPDEAEAPPELAAPVEIVVDERWANVAGAWVLGVLDPEDVPAATAAISASPQLQGDVAALQPVATILTGLYQTGTAPMASPETTVTEAAAINPSATPKPAKAVRERKPRTPTVPHPSIKMSRAMPNLPLAKVGLGALAVAAVLAILWAFSLVDKVSTRNDEIHAQATEIASLKSVTNASAYTLYPTAEGGTATGTLFYSPANGSALIDFIGLPALGDGQVFQLWFQEQGSNTWIPGPTFLAGSTGEAIQRLSGDAPTFAEVAISAEPSPGSTNPTGEFLLTGVLTQAAG